MEIDYDKKTVADAIGRYSIAIRKDYYIDSLYAWVDLNADNRYTAGEPFGFFRSHDDSMRAKPIHARNTDITNINFSIP